LNYLFSKLKDDYGLKFDIEDKKISYRETITKAGKATGRYIKQSGGSGYYGVVDMEFMPSDKIEFVSTVFGGHIDKGYFPAVEKGFLEAIKHGELVQAPVIKIKAILKDGKQHSVDSNEMAFKNAAILAFKEAYKNCKPILLEPYDQIVVRVNNVYLGNVLSDLTKRRGRILSTEEVENGDLDIVAVVPEAEILEYANEIKSLTKGTGFFNLTFEDYEEVPSIISEKVIKNHSI